VNFDVDAVRLDPACHGEATLGENVTTTGDLEVDWKYCPTRGVVIPHSPKQWMTLDAYCTRPKESATKARPPRGASTMLPQEDDNRYIISWGFATTSFLPVSSGVLTPIVEPAQGNPIDEPKRTLLE
jgi:hypothetical protein